MILGGELTSKQIKFDVGDESHAHHLQTMFVSRGSFFLVPPYDERLDILMDGRFIQFFRHDGSTLFYEDAKYIFSKILLFRSIAPEKAQELLESAREILPCVSTLLFPDPKRTVVECAVYENWARFDFSARQFSDLATKVKVDISNYLPANIKVTANTEREVTLPLELHSRFILNAEQFALKQAIRIFLHHTLQVIKDAESTGGLIYATYASDQALRVLKQLAEHGDIGLLNEGDAIFLSHVLLFYPEEFRAFEGVYELKPFMIQFIAAYGPEIRVLHDLRLREQSGTHENQTGRVGQEETDIIEGSTAKTLERDEEYRQLAERYQKKLGE